MRGKEKTQLLQLTGLLWDEERSKENIPRQKHFLGPENREGSAELRAGSTLAQRQHRPPICGLLPVPSAVSLDHHLPFFSHHIELPVRCG